MRPERLVQLLPWLALAAALAPVALNGISRGHDWQYELTRIAEFRHAVADGQVPPYWAGNLYAGYGSPVYLFYAPLHAAMASLLSLVTGDIPGAAAATLFLFGTAGVLALGAMIRAVPGLPATPAAARVAVYVYLLSPYLIGNALLRNANAEYAALCLLPLPFLGVFWLGRETRRGIAVIALGLGLVVLAHNLTALVALTGLLALGTILFLPERRWREAAALAAGLGLGLTIAAFLWIPALALKPLVRTEDLLVGKFDYHGQFPPLSELFAYREFYAVGLGPPLLFLAAIAFLRPWRGGAGTQSSLVPLARRLASSASAGTLVFLFLQTPASVVLWENLPWLAFFQFPWRFSGPMSLTIAIVVGLGFAEFARSATVRRQSIAEIFIFVLALANAFPHLAAARPLEAEIRDSFAASLEPAAIRRVGHRVTVLDEYLPRGADPTVWRRRPASEGPVVAATGPVRTTVVKDRGHHVELRIETAEAVRLLVGRWYFPGWRLAIDGEPGQLRRHPTGAIEIEAPAGQHRIEMRLSAPGGRPWIFATSLIGLALAGLLWIRSGVPHGGMEKET